MINLNRLRKDEILWLYNNYCRHNHRYIEHLSCFEKEKPRSPINEKIGFLDIEASNLKADFGVVISYCIKEENGDILEGVMKPSEIKKGIYDKNVLKKCVSDMRKFDRLVHYYGGNYRFDIPFIRSRAMLHGLDFPLYKEIKSLDLYTYVKKTLKLHNNRLQTACDFFGIASKEHPMTYDVWMKALSGKKKALDYILEHNREDVISTEKLYHKMLPYINTPNSSI